MSTAGILDFDTQIAQNSTANNKAVTFTFGGAAFFTNNIASATASRVYGRVRNRNSASVQSIQGYAIAESSGAIVSAPAVYGVSNTASAVNIVYQLGHATATDVAVLEALEIRVTNP
jgi:hypothetical protein